MFLERRRRLRRWWWCMVLSAAAIMMLTATATATLLASDSSAFGFRLHHHRREGLLVPRKSCFSFPKCLGSRRRRQLGSATAAAAASSTASSTADRENASADQLLDDVELVNSLDLVPIFENVASFAALRRSRDAILDLVSAGQVDDNGRSRSSARRSWQRETPVGSGRRRRVLEEASIAADATTATAAGMRGSAPNRRKKFKAPFASSAAEARREYERVEQATLALQQHTAKKTTKKVERDGGDEFDDDDDDDDVGSLTYSPHYGADWNPIDSIGEGMPRKVDAELDDYDEWLNFDSPQQFELEHVLQAEQIMNMLLRVRRWSEKESTRKWAPALADIASKIDTDDYLEGCLTQISDAVEVGKVRTIADPTGKSSYRFHLSATAFPGIADLRAKEEDILLRIRADDSVNADGRRRQRAGHLERELMTLREDIQVKEEHVRLSLAMSVIQCRDVVDEGMNLVAELDVLFAKAAYGIAVNGRIPIVGSEGKILVRQFFHPLLLQLESKEASSDISHKRAVPIDLILPTASDGNDDSGRGGTKEKNALIISGMNGGGKTFALKSFGVACILCRLGVPLPCGAEATAPPRVDLFDEILVSMGDGQDPAKGESTFTAKLNACSRMIQRLKYSGNGDVGQRRRNNKTFLVLLDELGSGTDAEAGGAIAQALLERLLGHETCRIVATTHLPRLKSLSFDGNMFQCASVLATTSTSSAAPRNKNQLPHYYSGPSFRLQYGIIGESCAMGAASRCDPPLPDDVLSRASELIVDCGKHESPGAAGFASALAKSLERQAAMAEEEMNKAREAATNIAKCQHAMMSLAEAYERELGLIENRLQNCYRELKSSSSSTPLDIIGDSMAEVQLVRRKVESEKEVLKQQGLKILPDSYELIGGESVIVIAEGEYNGVTCEVVSNSNSFRGDLSPDDVLVLPLGGTVAAGPLNGETSVSSSLPITFKRFQLAVWDYDSVWEEETQSERSDARRSKSVSDSKRRLYDVLSSLKQPSSSVTRSAASSKGHLIREATHSAAESSENFTSARERKASRRAKSKRRTK